MKKQVIETEETSKDTFEPVVEKMYSTSFPCQFAVMVKAKTEEEALQVVGEYLSAMNMISKSTLSPLAQPVLKEVPADGE